MRVECWSDVDMWVRCFDYKVGIRRGDGDVFGCKIINFFVNVC